MKIIFLVACVSSIVVVCYGYDNSKDMKSLQECLIENDIREDDLEKLKESEDPKLRCIMACILDKRDIIKNGEINKELLTGVTLSDFPELGERKAEEITNTCMNLAKSIKDVCEKSNLVAVCIKDELEKLGIKLDD